MNWSSGRRLFAVYAGASLVPLVVLGTAMSVVVQRQTDHLALNEATRQADTLVNVSVEPALDGTPVSGGITPAERDRLIRATTAFRTGGEVLRLRLRDTTGNIVFDIDHPDMGIVADEDDEVKEAASGELVRVVTRLNADEVDNKSLIGEQALEVYLAVHAPDGTVIAVQEIYVRYAPFVAAAGHVKRLLTIALIIGLATLWGLLALITASVTRRLRRTAAESDWLAHNDALTQLPNRLAFSDAVESSWAHTDDLAVVIADIARFREINDTLGPASGDQFLAAVAQRLRAEFTEDAFVARLGGDHFGLLFTHVPAADEVTRRAQSAMGEPIDVNGVTIATDAIIGLARRSNALTKSSDLLRAADLAVHAAKANGSNALAYSADLDHFDPENLALAHELRLAIESDELHLVFQPKVALGSRSANAVEALIRWNHPRRGLLSPALFIPVAESTSLIGPLTDWVIGRAAQHMAEWAEHDLVLSVAVNVSAADLRDPRLADRILRAMADAGADPTMLHVEITETAVVSDPRRAEDTIERLRRSGIHVSMDDFGQGATSLVSLTTLSLDEIKIDRAFIDGIEHRPDQQIIVQSIINLGHQIGMSVVAEGIETAEADAIVTRLGCDMAQGYFYARPMPADEIERWMADQPTVPSST